MLSRLRLPPALRQNLWILLGSSLLFWCSLSSLLPIVPLYVESLGGQPLDIGFASGAFAIGLIGSRSWLGRLADQRSRKLVLLIGMGVAAIAPLGYLIAPSIAWIFLIRIVHGISIAAYATAYITLVADLAPAAYRGEIMGYMALGNPLGTVLGPAIGGLLQEQVGYGPVFMLAAGLGLASFLAGSQIQAPGFKKASSEEAAIPLWGSFHRAGLGIPTLVLLLVGVAFGILHTFVALFIKGTGLGLNPGLFYTAAAVGSFGVRLGVGRAADRYGRGLFLTLSLVGYSLAMLILWTAHSRVQFLLAGLVEGMAIGILIPMISTLIADRTYPQERGRLFGFCITGLDLGIAIAGPLLGFLGHWLEYRDMFGIATLMAMLAISLFVTQVSKTVAGSIQFAFGFGRDIYALPEQKLKS